MERQLFMMLIWLLFLIINILGNYPDTVPIAVPTDHYTHSDERHPPYVLILHYTAEPLGRTLKIFLGYEQPEKKASSHYTVSEDGVIFQHVPEDKCAHHAGVSYWNGMSSLNKNSFGIEQVNLGFKDKPHKPQGTKISGSPREWYPYAPELIEATTQLCGYLIKKYTIDPRNVVAHSDVAPGRKWDPGPLFPWQQLATHGIGAWPDHTQRWSLPCFTRAKKTGNLADWLMTHLHIWGYQLPDKKTSANAIIQAFQMHFRQKDISGNADQETATILQDLLCKYVIKKKENECPCKLQFKKLGIT